MPLAWTELVISVLTVPVCTALCFAPELLLAAFSFCFVMFASFCLEVSTGDFLHMVWHSAFSSENYCPYAGFCLLVHIIQNVYSQNCAFARPLRLSKYDPHTYIICFNKYVSFE